jgi:hypothetical protein
MFVNMDGNVYRDIQKVVLGEAVVSLDGKTIPIIKGGEITVKSQLVEGFLDSHHLAAQFVHMKCWQEAGSSFCHICPVQQDKKCVVMELREFTMGRGSSKTGGNA